MSYTNFLFFKVARLLFEGYSLSRTAQLVGATEEQCAEEFLQFARFCRSFLNHEMQNLPPVTFEESHFRLDKKRYTLAYGYDRRTGLIPVYHLGRRHSPNSTFVKLLLAGRKRKTEPQAVPVMVGGDSCRFPDLISERRIIETKAHDRRKIAIRQFCLGFTGSMLKPYGTLENMRTAVAAFLAYHNYCSHHGPFGTSPAHAVGLAPARYTYEEFVNLARSGIQWDQ